MILEGLVTTLGPDGAINIAPMGPIVNQAMSRLVFRPYKTSRTYQNLKARPVGVFHVIDDVLLLAEAAIDRMATLPATVPAKVVEGQIITDACRWYEFEVENFDDEQERTTLKSRVVHMGRLRDWFGFNRAKHAVLEAAILATRVHLLPRDEILSQLKALEVPINKTAGPQEHAAFDLLMNYVRSELHVV